MKRRIVFISYIAFVLLGLSSIKAEDTPTEKVEKRNIDKEIALKCWQKDLGFFETCESFVEREMGKFSHEKVYPNGKTYDDGKDGHRYKCLTYCKTQYTPESLNDAGWNTYIKEHRVKPLPTIYLGDNFSQNNNHGIHITSENIGDFYIEYTTLIPSNTFDEKVQIYTDKSNNKIFEIKKSINSSKIRMLGILSCKVMSSNITEVLQKKYLLEPLTRSETHRGYGPTYTTHSPVISEYKNQLKYYTHLATSFFREFGKYDRVHVGCNKEYNLELIFVEKSIKDNIQGKRAMIKKVDIIKQIKNKAVRKINIMDDI